MDIKYPIKNEYMKCVLQINGSSGPRPWVRSNRRVGSRRGVTSIVMPPNRHPVSSEGVILFIYLFIHVYYKLINFKLVHSYNVKHLTCNIFCSNKLQNIYKLNIWKCSTFTIFTLLTKETKIHIH